jgi:hypothetical protein
MAPILGGTLRHEEACAYSRTELLEPKRSTSDWAQVDLITVFS